MALTTEETELKRDLLDIMHKHSLTEYKFKGQRVIVVPGEETVKVKSVETNGVEG